MTNNLKAERTLTAEELQGEFARIIREEVVADYTGSLLGVDRAVKAMASMALQSLSTQQPMGEVRVKALEWVEVTSPREDGPPEPIGEYVAETPFGSYYIDMYFGTDSYGWSANFEASDIDGSDSDSPEKAKAAAQADYERGILSALQPNQESGE